MSTTAYSSKTDNASTSIDTMMSMFLPKSIPPTSTSSSTSTFRTTKPSYANDPELYMGDDSDADYALALMQSGLFSSSSMDQDSDCSDTDDHTLVSLNRLRLMLAHLDPPPPSIIKGKSKAYY